jgi:hypothetical protein
MPENGGVTMRALTLQNRLYESPIEAQLMLVYDAHRRLVGASGERAFPHCMRPF